MNERARESSLKDYLIAVSYSILIMTGRVGGRQPFAYSVPFEIVDFLEAFVVCLRRKKDAIVPRKTAVTSSSIDPNLLTMVVGKHNFIKLPSRAE